MAETQPAPGPRALVRSRAIAAAVLLAALAGTVAGYRPALYGEFHLDDWTSVLMDPGVRDPGRIARDFRAVQLVGNDRVVTRASLAFDAWRGGGNPAPFHETSLAIHLVAALLVFVLVQATLRRGRPALAAPVAAFVAALFALHPVQAEAVAYAAQRSELLATALGLGALLLLLAADARWPRGRAWSLVAAATGLHLLALGAKSIAVVVPALFVLHRACFADPGSPPARTRVSRALALSAPLWALSAVSVARNLLTLGPGDSAGMHAGGGIGPAHYLLTQLRVHWLYAKLAAVPAGLSVERSIEPSPGLLHLPTLLALGATLAVIVAAAAWWARDERARDGIAGRTFAFGVGVWYVSLAPTSSLVPLDDAVVEHRMYLALLGALLAAVAIADAALRRLSARTAASVAAAAGCAWGIALGAALHARAEVWSSDLALWADAAVKSPSNARALTNLGYAHHARGEWEQARTLYERATRVATRATDAVAVARNLSGLHNDRGEFALGLATADRGLAIAAKNPDLLHNRAVALWKTGRLAEAEESLARAAALGGPTAPRIHDTLGLVLADRGDVSGALAAFRRARELDPSTPSFSEHEFVVLVHLRRSAEACGVWSDIARAGMAERVGNRARALALDAGCR